MIISHPAYKEYQQKPLTLHLANVAKGCKERIQRLSLSTQLINKQSLAGLAFRLGLLHDIGKTSSFFQNYIQGGPRTVYTKHSLVSAIIIYYDFMACDEWSDFALIGFKAVQRHHGNLSSFGTENLDNGVLMANTLTIYEDVRKQVSKASEISQFIDNHSVQLPDWSKAELYNLHFALQDFSSCDDPDDAIERFLIQNLLFSVLIDSDKYDAARIDHVTDSPLSSLISYSPDNYIAKINKRGGDLDKIRQQLRLAAENTGFQNGQKCFSMSAPTGTGKTMACMAFSDALFRNSDHLRRVIYCLPYTSIIDQNFEEISKVLSENGLNTNDPDLILKHHHLVDYSRSNPDEDYDYHDYMNDNLLADSWNAACVISTFVQLFHSLIGARNSLVRKLHNIVNSVILLDEVQSLPPKYYLLLRRIFYVLANRFDTYILTCTATQPFIYEPGSFNEVSPVKLFNHPVLNRVKLFIHRDVCDLKEFASNLDLSKAPNALFVMNTKSSASELFDLLKESYGQLFKVICLTTYHTPRCRMCYIKYVRDSLAANQRIILVSTQLIEAGVDISFARVYRDLGPLDSIIQVAGRCNRHGELGTLGGEMHLVMLKGKREYSEYVYDNYLINKTLESLTGRDTIESLDFPEIIRNYYQSLEFSADAQALLRAIGDLNYDLKVDSQKPIDQFRLIEDEYSTSTLYILLTKSAQNAMDELISAKDLLHSKTLDRESELKARLKVKKAYHALTQYQLNLRKSELKNYNIQMSFFNELDDEVYYIPNSDIGKAYSVEKGFLVDPLSSGSIMAF